MNALERIEINPQVCNGKPVIKGTRIPVSVVLERIAEGEPWEAILAAYPELVREDIQAAVYYARASIDHTEVEAVGA
jgi:uncharacterized protein (DUF433 family)